MKFASFSSSDRGVLGFLAQLAEGLLPLQSQASSPGTDGKGKAPRESIVPGAEPTTADPARPGPAAQWWQDHPAPGAPVFWIDEGQKSR